MANPESGKIDARPKLLTRVIRRAPVEIEFKELSFKIGKKDILQVVSGRFSSGNLIAILGPSGAGKTSLLNVLAGQIHNGVSGSININGIPRDMKKFHKISSYIMQEDLLQPLLTVRESMHIAAKLKLGTDYSKEEKNSVISEVVSIIGLKESMDTRVEHLSGGQHKRLSIALELVNNPPVLFLDEPTTGLDNVAMKNCVELLKSIALQGRTIICTIHQPSDSLFKLFDTVYFMSNGHCIYNGSVNKIVPFLQEHGFDCPITYSPADYIIEVVQISEVNVNILKEAIQNGKTALVESSPDRQSTFSEFEEDVSTHEFPNSFWTQFRILIQRMFLQMRRNKISLALVFGHHIFCGLFLGVLFYKAGSSGSLLLNNVKLFYGMVVYFLFTHVMAPILIYPFEVKLLQREYFNRWYSLKAYFAALTVSVLPVLTVTSLIFLAIAYPLTGQPLEIYRIFWFSLISILMAVTSQGFGYSIGSLFSPMIGACVGSALAIPLVLLGMYGIDRVTLDTSVEMMMSISFPYHAFVGLCTSVLNDRGLVECEEVFCYFGDAQSVLKVMGMTGKSYSIEALILVFFLILHRIGTCVFSAFGLPSVILSTYGFGFGDKIHPFIKFVMYIGHPRHAMAGLLTSVLSDRERVECDAEICFFNNPEMILKLTGMQNDDYREEAFILLAFALMFNCMMYFSLKCKLKWYYWISSNVIYYKQFIRKKLLKVT